MYYFPHMGIPYSVTYKLKRCIICIVKIFVNFIQLQSFPHLYDKPHPQIGTHPDYV